MEKPDPQKFPPVEHPTECHRCGAKQNLTPCILCGQLTCPSCMAGDNVCKDHMSTYGKESPEVMA